MTRKIWAPPSETNGQVPQGRRQLCLVGTKGNVITHLFQRECRRANVLHSTVYVDSNKRLAMTLVNMLMHRDLSNSWLLISGLLRKTGSVDLSAAEVFGEETLDGLKRQGAGLYLVCGCNKILGTKHFALGNFVNYHNSLLPAHGGVSSINWALYQDDPVGFTFHTMTPEIDVGTIICQRAVPVPERADVYAIGLEVHHAAARCVGRLLQLLADGSTEEHAECQQFAASYHSRKDTVAVEIIDEDDEETVRRKIRCFGTVRLTHRGKLTRVRRARVWRFGRIRAIAGLKRLFQTKRGVTIAAPYVINVALDQRR